MPNYGTHLPKIAFLTTVVWTFLFMSTQVWESDIWWHLKSGEQIVSQKEIPKTALFPYPYRDRPWIDVHWAFEVALYLLHAWGGFSLLILANSLLMTVALMLVTWPAWRARAWLWASFLLLLGSLLFNWRSLIRPEACSYCLLAVYLLLLESYCTRRAHRIGHTKSPAWIYCLPILQAIWTNLQGLSFLGIFVLSVYLGDELLASWRATNSPKPDGRLQDGHPPAAQRKQWPIVSPLLVSFLLALAATLVNPYGWRGAIFPLHLLGVIGGVHPVWKEHITEFMPLWQALAHWSLLPAMALGLLVLLPGLLAIKGHRLPGRLWVVYLAFLILSISAVRNTTLFCLAAILMLSQATAQMQTTAAASTHPPISSKASDYVWGTGGWSLAILGMIWLLVSGRYYAWTNDGRQFGFSGVAIHLYPERAVQYLITQALPGNLFHFLNDGGYLIYRLYPQYQVFIDTRIDPVIMDPDHFTCYLRMCSDRAYFEEMATKYRINTVIVRTNTSDQANMFANVFENNPRWEPVFYDEMECSLVVRRKK